MKILIYTNVILDFLLDRKPFNEVAAIIFAETEKGNLTSFISGTTVTTVFYLLEKALGNKASHTAMAQLLKLFEIAPITRVVLESALKSKFTDFEDAVIHEAGLHAGAEAVITRDPKGFNKAILKIYSPDEFIYSFKQK